MPSTWTMTASEPPTSEPPPAPPAGSLPDGGPAAGCCPLVPARSGGEVALSLQHSSTGSSWTCVPGSCLLLPGLLPGDSTVWELSPARPEEGASSATSPLAPEPSPEAAARASWGHRGDCGLLSAETFFCPSLLLSLAGQSQGDASLQLPAQGAHCTSAPSCLVAFP